MSTAGTLNGTQEALLAEVGELEPDAREEAFRKLRMLWPTDGRPSDPSAATAPAEALKLDSLAGVAADSAPPALLVPGVVPEGQVTWLAGHPAHGKTTIAMHVALTATRQGRPVLWLDWEGGMKPTARRLEAMGGTAEDLEHFHYVGYPRISPDAEGLALIMDALDKVGPGALVVFDSASKALATAGFSEDSNTDATKWTTEVVMPLRERATVLVIDHVTKGATRATPYARGAGSKLADTEVFWYVEAVTAFSREQIGELRLTKHKDREGVLPEVVRFSVGDGAGKLPVERLGGEGDSHPGVALGKARTAVLDVLRKHDGEELSMNQIEGMATGARPVALRDAAKALAADAAEPVSSRPGARNAVLYRFDAAAVTALEVG